MGHIKEPDGVDLVIKSRPLTKDEEVSISNYIRAYKAKHSPKKTLSKRTAGSVRKKIPEPLMKK
jgi:hypothetical protein